MSYHLHNKSFSVCQLQLKRFLAFMNDTTWNGTCGAHVNSREKGCELPAETGAATLATNFFTSRESDESSDFTTARWPTSPRLRWCGWLRLGWFTFRRQGRCVIFAREGRFEEFLNRVKVASQTFSVCFIGYQVFCHRLENVMNNTDTRLL